MKIFISPAKKMRINNDYFLPKQMPVLIDRTKLLYNELKNMSFTELKKLYKCSDEIAKLNYQRFQNMDLYKNTTPALMAYEGIQYQYMAPDVFENDYFSYVEEHLRILSGFYGILKPFDGVVSYRLEMQNKLSLLNFKNLYDFWGDSICEKLIENEDTVINLASGEYSKVVLPYLPDNVRCIECIFAEETNGKIIEKGVYVKMARGEMVRFLAEKNINNPENIKEFDRLGYKYRKDLSDENKYCFIKGE